MRKQNYFVRYDGKEKKKQNATVRYSMKKDKMENARNLLHKKKRKNGKQSENEEVNKEKQILR